MLVLGQVPEQREPGQTDHRRPGQALEPELEQPGPRELPGRTDHQRPGPELEPVSERLVQPELEQTDPHRLAQGRVPVLEQQELLERERMDQHRLEPVQALLEPVLEQPERRWVQFSQEPSEREQPAHRTDQHRPEPGLVLERQEPEQLVHQTDQHQLGPELARVRALAGLVQEQPEQMDQRRPGPAQEPVSERLDQPVALPEPEPPGQTDRLQLGPALERASAELALEPEPALEQTDQLPLVPARALAGPASVPVRPVSELGGRMDRARLVPLVSAEPASGPERLASAARVQPEPALVLRVSAEQAPVPQVLVRQVSAARVQPGPVQLVSARVQRVSEPVQRASVRPAERASPELVRQEQVQLARPASRAVAQAAHRRDFPTLGVER